MLSALYKTSHKDLFDALVPFVEYAIAQHYKIGHEISVKTITNTLNREFGFSSLPISATKMLLKRLSPKTIKIDHGKYYLSADLESAALQFSHTKAKAEKYCDVIGVALCDYLQERTGNRKIDPTEALDCLLLFFEKHGLQIGKETKVLNAIESKKAMKYEYYVAQFILAQQQSGSEIFNNLLEILKGFYLSLAISFHNQSKNPRTEKFRGTSCYLDTRIVLDLLGCNSKEDKDASHQLLKMLKEQSAEIKIFEHTYNEIQRIVNAYKYSLKTNYDINSYHTLEGFDSKQLSYEDVEIFQARMRAAIKELGIEIIKIPASSKDAFSIDEIDLEDCLRKDIFYGSDKAVKHDLDSIIAVAFLRSKSQSPSDTIEHCGHIFITPNTKLAKVVNSYFIMQNDLVPYVIDEPRFSALLWVKCYSTHENYPKIKLIQNAYASTLATDEVMRAFYQTVEQFRDEGGISQTEALALRTKLINRRELMEFIGGESKNVNKGTVAHFKNELKQMYGKQAQSLVNLKDKELEKEKLINRTHRDNATESIIQTGKIAEKKFFRRATIIKNIVLLILVIFFIVASLAEYANSTVNPIFLAGLIFISLVGIYELFSKQNSRFDRIIKRISKKYADKKMDKKRDEYNFLFK